MTYNGWTNYETWAANLWISNEYGWYLEVQELTQTALTDADGDKDAATYELADAIRSNVDDAVFGEDGDAVSGLASDLLRAAFGEIDFREIAEHWITDEYDAWREDNPAEESTG